MAQPHPRPVLTALLAVGGLAAVVAGVGTVLPRAAPETVWAQANTAGVPIDVEGWLANGGERLSPHTMLPRAHQLEPEVLAFLGAPCEGLPALDGDVAREKLAAFRRFECGGQSLSEDFFSTPPFLHPLGRSYAARAGRPHPRHIEEVSDAPLAGLSAQSRSQLVAGATLVIDPHLVLSRGPGGWRTTPRDSLDRTLSWAGLSRPGTCTSATCLIPTTRTWVWGSAWIAALCLGFALFAFGWRGLSDRRRYRDEQRFLVRALTHELRTPATAVGLSIDQIRPHFDVLPPPVQDAFLGLTASNQRLRSTLKATGSMLALMESGRPLELQNCDVGDVLEALGETGPRGLMVHTDPALLQLVVGNVVANAHHHGRPPVTITAAREATGVTLVVQDAGAFVGDPHEMAKPFARGEASEGLGLGLTLVNEALRALGGRWSVVSNPTRFSLHVPDL